MLVLHGFLNILKVVAAVGCVVIGILIFPMWYDVCTFLHDFVISFVPELDGLTDLFLTVFPFVSLLIIILGLYIGFLRLTGSFSGKDNTV